MMLSVKSLIFLLNAVILPVKRSGLVYMPKPPLAFTGRSSVRLRTGPAEQGDHLKLSMLMYHTPSTRLSLMVSVPLSTPESAVYIS